MSGTFVQKAVDAVHAKYVAALPGVLDTIETEESLTAGSLLEPVSYLAYFAGHDNSSPLLMVYDVGVDAQQQVAVAGHGVYVVRVAALLAWNGDADLSANERTMRRYFEALRRCVVADPTLAGAVIQARFLDARAQREKLSDRSATRYAYQIEWGVWIQE